MAFTLIKHHDCFSHQLNKITSKFSKSKTDIENEIKCIESTPLQGDRIREYGSLHLRKLRLPLKAYNIGKRGGLRVIYMIDEKNKWIMMVSIYSKRDNISEQDHVRNTKENLKSILSSLQ